MLVATAFIKIWNIEWNPDLKSTVHLVTCRNTENRWRESGVTSPTTRMQKNGAGDILMRSFVGWSLMCPLHPLAYSYRALCKEGLHTHTEQKNPSSSYNQITTLSELRNRKCSTASPLLSLVFAKSKKCFILSRRPLRPQSDKVPEPAGPVNQSMSPQGLQGEAEQKTGQIVEGTTYLAEWLATYGTSFADPKWSVNYNSRGRLFHKKNRFLRVQDQMAVTKMNDSGDYY